MRSTPSTAKNFDELEKHLDSCPRCQSELDSLHEVAGVLGNSVEPLPEELWSKIASQLPRSKRDEEPPPMPRLESATRSPFRAPSSGRTRRNRKVVALLGAVAVAAIAVAVVLGIDLVHSQANASHLQANLNESPASVALHTRGHRVATLRSGSVVLAKFVITPGGHGLLVSAQLPPLPPGWTYQLWGIVESKPISLGLLGTSPQGARFTIAGEPSATKLALTAEPAGGSPTPTGPILASGPV